MQKTTMFGALSVMAIVGLIAAPGCSATVEGAAKSYSSAACSKIFECAPVGAKAAYGDQAKCEGSFNPLALELFTLPDIAASADDLQHCADALKSASCAEYFAGQIYPACDIVGTRAGGDACAAGVQCESGSCSGVSDTECGKCRVRKAVGEVCTGATDSCEPGTFCGQAGKCTATPSKKGDACPDSVCAGGLFCDNGKCAGLKAAGAACQSFFECDYANGVTCDTTAMKCVQIKVVGVGEACGEALTSCAGDAQCDSATMKCVARPKLGEACSTDPDNCENGLTCESGKCAVPTPPTCE